MTARPHHFGSDDGWGYRCDGCLTVWRLGPEVPRLVDEAPECPVCTLRVARDRIAQLEALGARPCECSDDTGFPCSCCGAMTGEPCRHPAPAPREKSEEG